MSLFRDTRAGRSAAMLAGVPFAWVGQVLTGERHGAVFQIACKYVVPAIEPAESSDHGCNFHNAGCVKWAGSASKCVRVAAFGTSPADYSTWRQEFQFVSRIGAPPDPLVGVTA